MRGEWRCELCGKFDHALKDCPDSEENGGNPSDPFGKKDQCNQCFSFNHLIDKCPHTKENGSNPEGRNGKFQCGYCGSYDHLTHACERIHSRKLGKNSLGISGEKRSCQICNSFHHLTEDHGKTTDSCTHCGSFDHSTDHCPEITFRTITLLPADSQFQWRPLPIEVEEGKCTWCSSSHHSRSTCHRKHEKGIGRFQHPCAHCGSFNHLQQDCRHSEAKGKNAIFEGRKSQCPICGSFDHLICNDIHLQRNGKNPVDSQGVKRRCDYCGSFDHFERCPHSAQFGKNRGGMRCVYCGSHDHLLEGDCRRLNHMVRDFLRSKVGYDKKITEKFETAEASAEEKVVQIETERKILERLKCKAEGKGSVLRRSPAKEDTPTLEPEVPTVEAVLDVFQDVDLRTDPSRQPKITTKMHQEIVSALSDTAEGHVVKSFKITITSTDLYGLNADNWVNDNIIEFYMKMIADRSRQEIYRNLRHPTVHAMSTYFFQNLMMRGPHALERWTRKEDIFDFDVILIPIHQEEHWCLAVVDFRSPGVFYYDSMGGHNMPALSLIMDYLKQEYARKRNAELDLKNYVKDVVEDCPKQENGADCGIFACKIAEYLSRDAKLQFTQQDMPFYRKLMVYEISKKRLLMDQP